MEIQPLLVAVIAGIAFGIIRSNMKSKKEGKGISPYFESVIFTLIIYLVVSLVVTN
jgi:hypothetical protein